MIGAAVSFQSHRRSSAMGMGLHYHYFSVLHHLLSGASDGNK